VSLKFLSKLLTIVLKSTLKRHTIKSYKNTSHRVLREPRDVPLKARNSMQKTGLESETKRTRHGRDRKNWTLPDCLGSARGLSGGTWRHRTVTGRVLYPAEKNKRRTVRGSGADCPPVKTAKTEVRNMFWTQHAQGSRTVRTGSRTIRNWAPKGCCTRCEQ
jgi:hypothetical protein